MNIHHFCTQNTPSNTSYSIVHSNGYIMCEHTHTGETLQLVVARVPKNSIQQVSLSSGNVCYGHVVINEGRRLWMSSARV